MNRLGVEERGAFRAAFDETFWTTMEPIPGALDACRRLHAAGFELICVSALDQTFEAARLRNLRNHGFPIDEVIATGHHEGARSPKADAITLLDPVAFVDDYIAYMRGAAIPHPHRAGDAGAERQPKRRCRAGAGEVGARRPRRLCRLLAQSLKPLRRRSPVGLVGSVRVGLGANRVVLARPGAEVVVLAARAAERPERILGRVHARAAATGATDDPRRGHEQRVNSKLASAWLGFRRRSASCRISRTDTMSR